MSRSGRLPVTVVSLCRWRLTQTMRRRCSGSRTTRARSLARLSDLSFGRRRAERLSDQLGLDCWVVYLGLEAIGLVHQVIWREWRDGASLGLMVLSCFCLLI